MTFVTVMNHETDEDGITQAFPMEVELEDDDPNIVGYCSACGYPVEECSEYEEESNGTLWHAPQNCMVDREHEPDEDAYQGGGYLTTSPFEDYDTPMGDYYGGE